MERDAGNKAEIPMERYARNGSSITEEETLRLKDCRIAVVGCGGLGGYLVEMLARVGVGHITVVDGDRFGITNLNRQLLSEPGNLGRNKAEAAGERIRRVNPQVEVQVVPCMLTAGNARELLQGHDLAMDGVDNIPARLLLEDACEAVGSPLVHGAVGGWTGQVGVILPGDRLLHRIYVGVPDAEGEDDLPDGKAEREAGEEPSGAIGETTRGTPSFPPAAVAALQVSEALKLRLGKGEILRGSLLTLDLLADHFHKIRV